MVLSFAIWLPIFFGVLVLTSDSDRNPGYAYWISLIGSVISFVMTLPLVTRFDKTTAAMQFVGKSSWIERFYISYYLGVDDASMWFAVLIAFITVIMVISTWEVIIVRMVQYMAAFLILSGLVIGVFASLNGLLLYVFSEATLIPAYIIIGVWGGPNRVCAAFKFFLYVLLGSLLTLVVLLHLYFHGGTFEILQWHQVKLSMNEQILISLAFFMASTVKAPMWPVHIQLPDTHVEALTGGSVVLAVIMLKPSAYGFLRFSLPIVPDTNRSLSAFVIAISLVAVIYTGLVTLVQAGMKKLVAYSSIAHMGFVTLGFFIFNEVGAEGGIVQMISHGFISGAMFLYISMLHNRVHSRQVADYGGMVNTMPKFAALSVLFTMANCDLPAAPGFVGEFMMILDSIKFNFWIGLLAATALTFDIAYSLWMIKRVISGDVTHRHVAELKDLSCRGFSTLGVLAIATLYTGLYPEPFTDVMHAFMVDLLTHVTRSKL